MSLLACLLPAVAQNGQVLTPPEPLREFRAVWVATVDNIDWPSSRNLSTDDQKAELIRIFDVCKSLNINAVVLQVRPSADALYASKFEPWSEFLTGRQGQRPNPYYDPLAFAVDEAHKRGMELHCWFNPYRALHPAQKGPVDRQHLSKTNPGVVKKYGDYMWMDPGESIVQKRTLDVMMDTVDNYDIDGIHIDDYFYPYKSYAKGADFPDDASWTRYQRAGGKLNRGDWRRKNVDDFIRRIYQTTKKHKRWVKFGISPFGIYRPGFPEGIQAGVDQYADLYADARRWLAEGWVDYFTPQLYWPIQQTAQSYPKLLQWWEDQNAFGRHLWPGNYTSRVNPADGKWSPQEVVDQIMVTRKLGANGNVHFSAKAFLKDWGGIDKALRDGPYREPALVPASPWLDSRAPNAPKVTVERESDTKVRVRWTPSGDDDVRFYAVCTQDDRWRAPQIGSGTSMTIEGSVLPLRLAVTAIDRCGNASKPTVVRIAP